MCLRHLDDGLRIGPLVVELLPHRPVAPSGLIMLPRLLGIELVQQVDVLVGGHGPEYLRRGQRALRVHVAPPADRLHPAHLAHAPVVAEHGPQLGVDASLDAVVGPGHGALQGQVRVEVREQQVLVQQRVQAAPGLPEPLVRVLPTAVDHGPVLQEVAPELVPLHVALHPPLGLAQVPYAHKLLRQPVELPPRLQLRPGRRAALDLAERVEQAPLDPGLRPLLGHCGREPAAAVGDHHLRGRDARQQRPPRPRRLLPRQAPRQHVLVAAGDQHHEAPREADAVDVDDAMDLVDHVGDRPDAPEPLGHPAEAAALAGHGELTVLREQPSKEALEVPGIGVVPVDGACAARLAVPPLRPGLCEAVPLHRLPAGGAFLRLHPAPREIGDFFTGFMVPDLGKRRDSDTLFVRVGNLPSKKF